MIFAEAVFALVAVPFVYYFQAYVASLYLNHFWDAGLEVMPVFAAIIVFNLLASGLKRGKESVEVGEISGKIVAHTVLAGYALLIFKVVA